MSTRYAEPIDIATHCAAISNQGNTWRANWQGLLHGRRAFVSGPDLIEGWPDGPPIAVIDFARFGVTPTFADRFATLARCIALDMKPAIDSVARRLPRTRISIIIASSAGDPGCLSSLVDAEYRRGAAATVTTQMLEGLLGGPWVEPVTDALGRDYPATAVFGACASSLVGISYACDRINADLTDAVLLIALDTLSRFACVGFNSIGAAASAGCTPYDLGRDGTTVGEGAVGLLLTRKGLLYPAEVAGRVAGASVYCDAAHMVEPNPQGVAKVVSDALGQADLASGDIAGVYWHGTGTKQNDKTEAAVASLVFGDQSPPCTSTKGALGHTMGASGGFNVLSACAGFASGLMPHVAGTADPEYSNLDLVLGAPRAIDVGPVLVTALGFGGINAATVLLPPLPMPLSNSAATQAPATEHAQETAPC